MKKSTQLRRLIFEPQLEFIIEAHNGISAKIAEEAGFSGIWASGLAISASFGVRDNNEASWTQVLEMLEFMSDASSVPILLDGDTGYGNFNNMRRLVKKLEQREIGGVCIEDKIFPKTNSFLRGNRQPLADIDEFCGKIKAGKDMQKDDDFVIAARVEAFIAGWGLAEALKRAEAYRKAGADAILIHSKRSDSSEIFQFLDEWNNRSPVIIVPTKYYRTPTSDFRKRKVSMIIWANHMIRGAVWKMREISSRIYKDQNLLNVEDMIVPVKEIFRLQNDQEIAEAEKRYLPDSRKKPFKAVILAATRGEKLGYLTEDLPKTMLKIGRETILEKIVVHLYQCEIKDITVVTGYKSEKVNLPNISKAVNERYEESGQLFSLSMALDKLDESTLIIFGDILFRKYVMEFALEDPEDIVVIVDSSIKPESENPSDYVIATREDNHSYFGEASFVKRIDFSLPDAKYSGEWIGIMKLSPRGARHAREFMEKHLHDPNFYKKDVRDMINYWTEQGIRVKIQYISGHWVDINNIADITLAGEF